MAFDDCRHTSSLCNELIQNEKKGEQACNTKNTKEKIEQCHNEYGKYLKCVNDATGVISTLNNTPEAQIIADAANAEINELKENIDMEVNASIEEDLSDLKIRKTK